MLTSHSSLGVGIKTAALVLLGRRCIGGSGRNGCRCGAGFGGRLVGREGADTINGIIDAKQVTDRILELCEVVTENAAEILEGG
jgi:hypothetical protein